MFVSSTAILFLSSTTILFVKEGEMIMGKWRLVECITALDCNLGRANFSVKLFDMDKPFFKLLLLMLLLLMMTWLLVLEPPKWQIM